MSDIVLKDRQGTKQTHSGVEVIKIADSEGNYNNYVAEPTGDIKITANGSVDVSKYASATVAVPGGSVAEWDGTGIVIAPIEPEEPEQPITFTINGISYTMENRMTWYAWTRSEYNTDGFSCASENDYVYEAESSNKVTDADGNDVLGTTVIVEGGAYLIKEAVTEDELAGTWVFNDTIEKLGDDTWSVNCDFVSNEAAYTTFYAFPAAFEYLVGVSGPRVYRYDQNVWEDEAYKTVTINTTYENISACGDATAETFLAWLKANATKQ